MPEGAKVQKMFAGIAKRYDFANLLLSGGCSLYWTRRLVALARRSRPQEIADLATGSGDVAFELKRRLPKSRVRGFDFCEEMLDVARERAKKIPGAETVEFAFGDCMALPLADASADAVTIAYGVRNFEDRQRGLREILRILKPGGKAFILEFTQPSAWFRPIYYLYLKFLLPLIARIVTGDKKAYDYLAGSIEAFPPKERLSAELREAGFSEVRAIGLTASIVAVHIAAK
ncbi:MAG: bifunctional demethylmenaquinone methyltransferase/2-methoxy-6-polyprenyl-1,4-benzoquinol methylase UbiE [Opitutales bacterium]|nr:bifunctional demethylmenaquinone methyltransferase/2-methoxy-6-polyprenyl-1,4-benzoquinol methylase UbiE [Opitutales bacterium]